VSQKPRHISKHLLDRGVRTPRACSVTLNDHSLSRRHIESDAREPYDFVEIPARVDENSRIADPN